MGIDCILVGPSRGAFEPRGNAASQEAPQRFFDKKRNEVRPTGRQWRQRSSNVVVVKQRLECRQGISTRAHIKPLQLQFSAIEPLLRGLNDAGRQ